MKTVKDFEAYNIIAHPLPERKDRVLIQTHGRDIGVGVGVVDYGSFSLMLGEEKTFRKPVILVEHGGGKEVYDIESPWIVMSPLITLALDKGSEKACYAILFALYESQDTAFSKGYNKAQDDYRTAFVEGRLKKRKVRGQMTTKVWIEPRAPKAVQALSEALTTLKNRISE